MAKEIIEKVVDDIDGSKAAESISFSVDGTAYEIDLSAANVKKFHSALQIFVDHAREVRTPRATRPTRSGSRRGPGPLKEQGLDAKAIRAWAKEQNIEAGTLGRVPAAVIEQYRAAHGL